MHHGLLGGDSLFYYKGLYEFDQATGRLHANIRATAFVAGAIPIFGIPASSFSLDINGTVSGDTATVTGIVSEMPSVKMQINLVKRADKIGAWARGTLGPRPTGASDIYWCYTKKGPTAYLGRDEEYRKDVAEVPHARPGRHHQDHCQGRRLPARERRRGE